MVHTLSTKQKHNNTYTTHAHTYSYIYIYTHIAKLSLGTHLKLNSNPITFIFIIYKLFNHFYYSIHLLVHLEFMFLISNFGFS